MKTDVFQDGMYCLEKPLSISGESILPILKHALAVLAQINPSQTKTCGPKLHCCIRLARGFTW